MNNNNYNNNYSHGAAQYNAQNMYIQNINYNYNLNANINNNNFNYPYVNYQFAPPIPPSIYPNYEIQQNINSNLVNNTKKIKKKSKKKLNRLTAEEKSKITLPFLLSSLHTTEISKNNDNNINNNSYDPFHSESDFKNSLENENDSDVNNNNDIDNREGKILSPFICDLSLPQLESIQQHVCFYLNNK